MILNVTAAQREYLRTALEIYSDELSDAAEAIHSRRLKQASTTMQTALRRCSLKLCR